MKRAALLFLALGALGACRRTDATPDSGTRGSRGAPPGEAGGASDSGAQSERADAVLALLEGSEAAGLPERATSPARVFDPMLSERGPTRGPIVRQGPLEVNGDLPPQIITRIVRQHYGRFRLCYERALVATPKLRGSVVTTFVIDEAGTPTSIGEHGSTLPDRKTVACIVDAFRHAEFPKPEKGVVRVSYTLDFAPPDG